MSKRNPGNLSDFRKAPSKSDLKGLQRLRAKEEKDLREKMNVPERDAMRYPMPDGNAVKEATVFLYTLNSVAASADGNLNALVQTFHVSLSKCLKAGSDENDFLGMAKALTELKAYVTTCRNPLFSDKSITETEDKSEGKTKK